MCETKYRHDFTGLLDFHSSNKVLFAVHSKHSSFWPSADVKPMSKDLVYEMHVCSLYVSTLGEVNCPLALKAQRGLA